MKPVRELSFLMLIVVCLLLLFVQRLIDNESRLLEIERKQESVERAYRAIFVPDPQE